MRDERNYVYIGVEEQLKVSSCNQSQPLHLEINIDGMAVSSSAKTQIWPILVSVKGINSDPVLVAAYIGTNKPDPHQFLMDFVNEMEILMNRSSGLRVGDVFFTCDLPAKKLIKCCTSYTGYGSCDYCTVGGQHYKNRRIFINQSAALRTDEQFRTKEDTAHHCGDSPLLRLPIDMVNAFAIDYMHCICLGVCRRLLVYFFIIRGKGRLSLSTKNEVSNNLLNLSKFWPSEFSRKPRSLNDIKYWKATEFRSFLFYSGPIVLNKIPKRHYQLFLLLHCGISLLAGEITAEKLNKAIIF